MIFGWIGQNSCTAVQDVGHIWAPVSMVLVVVYFTWIGLRQSKLLSKMVYILSGLLFSGAIFVVSAFLFACIG